MVADVIKSINHRNPKLMSAILRDGLRSYLLLVRPPKISLISFDAGLIHASCLPMQSEKAKVVVKVNLDDPEIEDHTARLRPLLIALASFGESTASNLREELISDLLVIVHHPRLAASHSGVWLDLLRCADIAPEDLVSSRAGILLPMIWSDASLTPSVRRAWLSLPILSFSYLEIN